MFEVREYERKYTGVWWEDTGEYKVYPYLTEELMYDALSAKHGVPTDVHRGSGFNIDHTRWTWGRAKVGREVIVGEFMISVERHHKTQNGWTCGGRRVTRHESRTAMSKALTEDYGVPIGHAGDGYHVRESEVVIWGAAGQLPAVTRNSLLASGMSLYVNGKPADLDDKNRFDMEVSPVGRPPVVIFRVSRPPASDTITVRTLRRR